MRTMTFLPHEFGVTACAVCRIKKRQTSEFWQWVMGRGSAVLHRLIWEVFHFGSLGGLSTEAVPSTLSLSTLLPKTTRCLVIRRRCAFDLSRKSCFAPSTFVWRQTAYCRAIQSELPRGVHLFWTISETLYPSRLISFSTNPSLAPTSPRRWVLETLKTFRTEVIREQRHQKQRLAATRTGLARRSVVVYSETSQTFTSK